MLMKIVTSTSSVVTFTVAMASKSVFCIFLLDYMFTYKTFH